MALCLFLLALEINGSRLEVFCLMVNMLTMDRI